MHHGMGEAHKRKNRSTVMFGERSSWSAEVATTLHYLPRESDIHIPCEYGMQHAPVIVDRTFLPRH